MKITDARSPQYDEDHIGPMARQAGARTAIDKIQTMNFLIVGVGGFIGSVARYKLGQLVLQHATGWKFPVSTFVVNVTGCLIAGVLLGAAEKHTVIDAGLRLFLFTGLLGGFTTFSAFGVETVYLLQRNELGIAALNVLLSVLVGLSALWMGTKVI